MQFLVPGIRVFQFLFGVIVLGLSVSLARGQVVDSAPPVTGYAAFTGGLGVLAAIIGAVALFVTSLDGLVTWVLDGVAALAFLAGGIAFAVMLKGTKCGDKSSTWDNGILNGGCTKIKGQLGCGYTDGALKSRCTSAQADTAFMFISFCFCVAVVACSFFLSGKRQNYGGSGYA